MTSNTGMSFTGSLRAQGAGVNLVIDRVIPGAGITHIVCNFIVNGAYTVNVSAGSNTSGTAGLTVRNTTTLNGNTVLDVTRPGAANTLLTLTGDVSGSNTGTLSTLSSLFTFINQGPESTLNVVTVEPRRYLKFCRR